MDTLHGTSWDVVIAGTGLQESLLALSLSRSGKKVLHVDKNKYYGGAEAALSLQDAEEWRDAVAASSSTDTVLDETGIDAHSTSSSSFARYTTPFSNVRIETFEQANADDGAQLSFSRAYSLALAPHILYAQSAILPTLVSSRIDQQLDFLVLGSWWKYNGSQHGTGQKQEEGKATLIRVPNSREDLFANDSIPLKDKRAVVKVLRFVGEDPTENEMLQENKSTPFHEFLQTQFKLSVSMQQLVEALAMTSNAEAETPTEEALLRVARHIRSIGVFGSGFGAVVPKWGGLAEMAQVACRACAVGGGVYVLGNGLADVSPKEAADTKVDTHASYPQPVSVQLDSGDVVETTWIVSGEDNLPAPMSRSSTSTSSAISTMEARVKVFSRSISVISQPLQSLFPTIGEGGQTSAGAVIVFPSQELGKLLASDGASTIPPVHIIAHSSDTGECPSGQCILYANIALPSSDKGYDYLSHAVGLLLTQLSQDSLYGPRVLWSMKYEQHASTTASTTSRASYPSRPNVEANFVTFPRPPLDMTFDDSVLKRVQEAWKLIVEEDVEGFMTFEQRETTGELEDQGS